MGRYTSVQAYADNNANVRSIPYDEATGGAAKSNSKGGGVETEKVSNPYGSTAGAGSGEFHVYRHARAREAARWKELDASEQRVLDEQRFLEELKQTQDEEADKTAKRRKKRQREKEAKQRKKHLKAAGILTSDGHDNSNDNDDPTTGDGEFTYVPEENRLEKEAAGEGAEDPANGPTKQASDVGKDSTTPGLLVEAIPNDGSFLELMKQKLQAQNQGAEEDEEGPIIPQPTKKLAVESRIIDEDDEEGPMPFM